jgi:hypothetical protein
MWRGAPSAASVRHPIGNKKAKIERNGAALLAAMGASIDMPIDEVVSSSKDRDYDLDVKNDQRWKVLLENAEHMIKLEEAKVEAERSRPSHPHPCHEQVVASRGDQDEERFKDLGSPTLTRWILMPRHGTRWPGLAS